MMKPMRKPLLKRRAGRGASHPRAKKSLGQNFLMHRATAARIADAAHLTPESIVLEIGPGTGMLTRELLARAKKVIAVEADVALLPGLEKMFAKEIALQKLKLLHGDIRHFTLAWPIGQTKEK